MIYNRKRFRIFMCKYWNKIMELRHGKVEDFAAWADYHNPNNAFNYFSERKLFNYFNGALDHHYVLSIYFPLISYSLTWLHYDIFRTSSKRHKPSTGFLNSVYSKILILIKTLFYFSLQQFPSAILLRCGLASVYRVRMHVHHYPKSARTSEISASSYMRRHLYFLKIFKTIVTSAYWK